MSNIKSLPYDTILEILSKGTVQEVVRFLSSDVEYSSLMDDNYFLDALRIKYDIPELPSPLLWTAAYEYLTEETKEEISSFVSDPNNEETYHNAILSNDIAQRVIRLLRSHAYEANLDTAVEIVQHHRLRFYIPDLPTLRAWILNFPRLSKQAQLELTIVAGDQVADLLDRDADPVEINYDLLNSASASTILDLFENDKVEFGGSRLATRNVLEILSQVGTVQDVLRALRSKRLQPYNKWKSQILESLKEVLNERPIFDRLLDLSNEAYAIAGLFRYSISTLDSIGDTETLEYTINSVFDKIALTRITNNIESIEVLTAYVFPYLSRKTKDHVLAFVSAKDLLEFRLIDPVKDVVVSRSLDFRHILELPFDVFLEDDDIARAFREVGALELYMSSTKTVKLFRLLQPYMSDNDLEIALTESTDPRIADMILRRLGKPTLKDAIEDDEIALITELIETMPYNDYLLFTYASKFGSHKDAVLTILGYLDKDMITEEVIYFEPDHSKEEFVRLVKDYIG